MKNYEIEVHRTMCNWITVEANSKDETFEIVHQLADKDHRFWDYYNDMKKESVRVSDEMMIEYIESVSQ